MFSSWSMIQITQHLKANMLLELPSQVRAVSLRETEQWFDFLMTLNFCLFISISVYLVCDVIYMYIYKYKYIL